MSTGVQAEPQVTQHRAAVIGIGMIGGSIAAGLRARGWWVTGDDADEVRCKEAVARGVIDAIGRDPGAEVTFVATPVSSIAEIADQVEGGGVVTDVGSVKGGVVDSVEHRCFVGGHPMAGSERSGLDGVDPDLFEGATWVLTPSSVTDPQAYLRIRNVVGELGAHVVTLDADEHDEIVATISHVPHLTASALMSVAASRAHEHEAVLRLAAGGFRDMTRIAAGHPQLWADIVMQNRAAILDALDLFTTQLDELRELISNDDRKGIEAFLSAASQARIDLPRRGRPAELSLVRVPIPDRPGALGQVLGLFGELHINVEDLEIVHDTKGDRGTLHVTVATSSVDALRTAFAERSLKMAVEEL